MSDWSWGIEVASMSMPATLVSVGLAASTLGAAVPAAPSRSASNEAKRTERRTDGRIAGPPRDGVDGHVVARAERLCSMKHPLSRAPDRVLARRTSAGRLHAPFGVLV